jgi:succinyl-diaminopimelate desuccinylase
MSEVVDLTRELVGARTVNPPGDEAPVAARVGQRLEAAGLDVRVHPFGPGRASLVARLPGRGDAPALCLTGHLDTVPFGDAAWAHHPLAGETDGDRLFGRGTSDMKGGVAAIVVAAERVAALSRGAAGLEVVLCAGEETGCDGARALAEAGVLGRAGAVLVAEPTANRVCVAHKGVAWLDARTSGRSAHGSRPDLGSNAIQALAHAVVALESFAFDVPAHPLLGAPTLNVGTIAGGANINSVPDRAVAGIDVRTIPGLTSDDVLAALRRRLGAGVALEPRLSLPPVTTDASDPWVADVRAAMDAPDAPGGVAYFTDAAALTPAFGGPPTVICGPGDPEQAHATDESCSLARLEAAAEGFFAIARRWCGV